MMMDSSSNNGRDDHNNVTTSSNSTPANGTTITTSSNRSYITTDTGIDVEFTDDDATDTATATATVTGVKPCLATTIVTKENEEEKKEENAEEYYVVSYPMIGDSMIRKRKPGDRDRSNKINSNESSKSNQHSHSYRGQNKSSQNSTNKSSSSNSSTRSGGGRKLDTSLTSTIRNVLMMSGDDSTTNGLKPSQKLFIDQRLMNRSIYVLRFAILSDAINMTLLQPNYPFMVTPGAYPDSFPTTAPFDYSSAVTFLMMMAKLGAAIASLGIGSLSDKIGRKPCIVFCLSASCLGSMLKYFCRFSYWAFCGACFVNGLVSATMPVATAYIGDVVSTREEVQKQMTVIFGMFLLGMGGGGIIATIMTSTGLFMPLWVGVALNAFASFLTILYLIEPNKRFIPTSSLSSPASSFSVSNTNGNNHDNDNGNDGGGDDNESDIETNSTTNNNNRTVSLERKDQNDDKKQQEQKQQQHTNNAIRQTLNYKVYLIIVAGALFDTIGSSGLFSLNYTILAKEKYIDTGIISAVAFKWTSSLIMFAIIPGIIMAPVLFRKIGIAKASIMANILTGLMTLGILYLITATKSEAYMYWITMAVIFTGFPFTVISQVSVTPMVQVVAPAHQRGICQGFASSINQIGGPVSTYLLGLLIQNTTDEVGVWVTIIISFVAAIVNLPLTRVEGMGPITPKVDNTDDKVFDGEDPELIKHIMDGNWVPLEELVKLNRNRRLAGHSYLVVPYGSYKDDKDRLSVIQKQARSDVRAQYNATESFFGEFNDSTEEVKNEICEGYNRSVSEVPTDVKDRQYQEFGKWITDYLTNNGYPIHVGAQLYKSMIMQAFPKIGDKSDLTVKNCEQKLLCFMRVLDDLSSDVNDEDDKYGYSNLLIARAGVASSRAEDLIAKKDN